MRLIVLPWPDRALHPNSRPHFMQKARATKKARRYAFYVVKQAGLPRMKADALDVSVTFHPPNNHRHDVDNALSAAKAFLDGIADAIGVDDSRFHTIPHMAEAYPPHGAVHVQIKESE